MEQKIFSSFEIQQILNPVFSQYNIRKAILFGSYAKGTASERSDVDLFVDSGLKGLSFFGFLEDVVTALNKRVDMLDSSQVKIGSEVDLEIKESGMVIYEQ